MLNLRDGESLKNPKALKISSRKIEYMDCNFVRPNKSSIAHFHAFFLFSFSFSSQLRVLIILVQHQMFASGPNLFTLAMGTVVYAICISRDTH